MIRARADRHCGLDLAGALGLVAGAVADALVADPVRHHPVAGYGRLMSSLERSWWRPSRSAGLGYALAGTAPVLLAAAAADLAARRHPVARLLLVTAATWVALGGSSLRRHATALAAAVGRGDLAAARERLPWLCGRDPRSLDGPALLRGTIESVAENTSDAVVAPLCWGAVGGLPGLLGYRAVNTLDAMVGHRSDRYAQFGTVTARVDDMANLLPARAAAALATLLAPLVGGRRSAAWRIWRRDGPAHPSPNAGRVEAAFAGALGVRLGGPVRYPYGLSERPQLGDGREPEPADVLRAARLSRAVSVAALAAAAAVRLAWRPVPS